MPSPIDANQIVQLQVDLVDRWHTEPVECRDDGFLKLVCQQHGFNFRLWHEEDIARSPTASDTQVAQVKRTIDRLNQFRNDAIEQLDDALSEILNSHAVACASTVPLNSETVGSIIDRLSIMALRLYHYREQIVRNDTDAAHRRKVQQRIALCQEQHGDLAESLRQLLDDLFAGRKRHKTYRQMKMYNDPSLNPVLYQAKPT